MEAFQVIDVVGRSDCSIRKHEIVSEVHGPVAEQALGLILIQPQMEYHFQIISNNIFEYDE